MEATEVTALHLEVSQVLFLGGARLTTTKMYPRDGEFKLRVKLADNQEQLLLRGKWINV